MENLSPSVSELAAPYASEIKIALDNEVEDL